MAAAVEQMMPSGYLVVTDPIVNDQDLAKRLRIQNAYISFTVLRNMLRSDNLNGLHSPVGPISFTHELIVESGVREVAVTLEDVCTRLKSVSEEEMETLLRTLEMTGGLSDSGLCDNYQRVTRLLMAETISFGRITSLFLFTYVLCKRLHRDCRQLLVQSVVGWMNEFLNGTISPWLVDHHDGQWSNLQGTINVDRFISRRKGNLISTAPAGNNGVGTSQNGAVTSSSWLTMAALGVGAIVVGALASR